MRLGIAEILKKVSEVKKREEKIEMLRKYDSPVLRYILQLAYDPKIQWKLPEGKPPYKPAEFLDQESRLYQEARRLYLFLEGGNDNLKPIKREMLFINLLESLAPADAELLCEVKEKRLPHKNITPELVKEAFPGILS